MAKVLKWFRQRPEAGKAGLPLADGPLIKEESCTVGYGGWQVGRDTHPGRVSKGPGAGGRSGTFAKHILPLPRGISLREGAGPP